MAIRKYHISRLAHADGDLSRKIRLGDLVVCGSESLWEKSRFDGLGLIVEVEETGGIVSVLYDKEHVPEIRLKSTHRIKNTQTIPGVYTHISTKGTP